MLYVDADTCVDCGACATACPADAIVPHTTLTEAQEPFLALNAEYFDVFPHATVTPLALVHEQRRLRRVGPFRVAVVGAGPAGLYTADELLKHPEITVDVFDRLPTPYGLVRSGVAPDHQHTKQVQRLFAQIEQPARLPLLPGGRGRQGPLPRRAGRPLPRGRLHRRRGHRDRPLGVPGDDLRRLALGDRLRGLVQRPPRQAGPRPSTWRPIGRAVIVGNGNVALDWPASSPRTPTCSRAPTSRRAYARAASQRRARGRGAGPARPGRGGVHRARSSVGLAGHGGVNVVVDTGGAARSTGADAKSRLLREMSAAARSTRRSAPSCCASWPRRSRCTGSAGSPASRSGATGSSATGPARPAPSPTGETEVIEAGVLLRAVGYHGLPVARPAVRRARPAPSQRAGPRAAGRVRRRLGQARSERVHRHEQVRCPGDRRAAPRRPRRRTILRGAGRHRADRDQRSVRRRQPAGWSTCRAGRRSTARSDVAASRARTPPCEDRRHRRDAAGRHEQARRPRTARSGARSGAEMARDRQPRRAPGTLGQAQRGAPASRSSTPRSRCSRRAAGRRGPRPADRRSAPGSAARSSTGTSRTARISTGRCRRGSSTASGSELLPAVRLDGTVPQIIERIVGDVRRLGGRAPGAAPPGRPRRSGRAATAAARWSRASSGSPAGSRWRSRCPGGSAPSRPTRSRAALDPLVYGMVGAVFSSVRRWVAHPGSHLTADGPHRPGHQPLVGSSSTATPAASGCRSTRTAACRTSPAACSPGSLRPAAGERRIDTAPGRHRRARRRSSGCGRRTGWPTSAARTSRPTTRRGSARSAGSRRSATTSGLVVHRGEPAYAVLNLYPYAPGHLMVCPYRHIADYTDTTDDGGGRDGGDDEDRDAGAPVGVARRGLQHRDEPGRGRGRRASPPTCTSTSCPAGSATRTSCRSSAAPRRCRSCSGTPGALLAGRVGVTRTAPGDDTLTTPGR